MTNKINVLELPAEVFSTRELYRFSKSEASASQKVVNVEVVYDESGNPSFRYPEEAEVFNHFFDLRSKNSSKSEASEALIVFVSNIEVQTLILQLLTDDKAKLDYINKLFKLTRITEDRILISEIGIDEGDLKKALSTRDLHVTEKPLEELVSALEWAGFSNETARRVALLSNVDFTFTNAKGMTIKPKVARNFTDLLEASVHLFDQAELEILYSIAAFVTAKSYSKIQSDNVGSPLLEKLRELIGSLAEMEAADSLEFLKLFFDDPKKQVTPKRQAIIDAVDDACEEHAILLNHTPEVLEQADAHPHLKTRVIIGLLKHLDVEKLAQDAVEAILKKSADMSFYLDLLELGGDIVDRSYMSKVLQLLQEKEQSTKISIKKGKDLAAALDKVAEAISKNKDYKKDIDAFREFLTDKDFSLGITARLLASKKLSEPDVKVDILYSLLPEDHPGGETLDLLAELSPYANAQTFAPLFIENTGLEALSVS